MLLGVTAALLPNLAWQGIRRTYFPSDANIIQVTPLLIHPRPLFW